MKKKLMMLAIMALTVCSLAACSKEEAGSNQSGRVNHVQDEDDDEIDVIDLDGDDEGLDGGSYADADIYDLYEMQLTDLGELMALGGVEDYIPNWMIEANASSYGAEAYSWYGYTFTDITGDDVPELLIMPTYYDDNTSGNSIVAAYTVVDGYLVNILDGWSRNTYYHMSDGRVLNVASGGAAYSAVATLEYNEDSNLFELADVYFSDLDENNELVVYYAYGSMWDKTDAEATLLSIDDMWDIQEDYMAYVECYSVSPMTDYMPDDISTEDYSDLYVYADYYENYADIYPYVNTYVYDDNEYACEIIFFSETDGLSVDVLELELFGYSDVDYQPVYSISESYFAGILNAGDPLVITLNLEGDIPTKGICITDSNGKMTYLSVGTSGYDGSIILSEF